MKTAKLEISGARLEFHISENNWCRVELHTEDKSFMLGAQDWDILRNKIINAFTTLSNSSEPEWILTLAEKHCGLFRQSIDGMNYFFWIDDQAEKIWESKLVAPISKMELKAN